MSFSNTKTPLKPTGKAKFQCPKRQGAKGSTEYYLTPELEEEFRRRYPETMNRRMMQLFGISFSTLQRFKRKLGLKKNETVIRKKLAAQIKKINESNGWYESLRGKAPSPQSIEATKKLRASGFNPLKIMKEKDPERFARMVRSNVRKRKSLEKSERRRIELGLSQKSALHRPYRNYTKTQLNHRRNAKLRGYILGAKWEETGERMLIFHTPETQRAEKFEQNCIDDGFEIRSLPVRSEVKARAGWNI